jgi:hypothetical protein
MTLITDTLGPLLLTGSGLVVLCLLAVMILTFPEKNQ